MPQYQLIAPYARGGFLFAQGTILSTDGPESGLFYVSPQEAERLVAEGVLAEHVPEALTGTRSQEPGWRQDEQRERSDTPDDYRAPWG